MNEQGRIHDAVAHFVPLAGEVVELGGRRMTVRLGNALMQGAVVLAAMAVVLFGLAVVR